ncbi:MAG: nuclear transport factor 2 family protein [Coriobacteriia bacterium]|nr:nuclear transport factor 2 family protein [Coriobacteriia bacterium]
MDSKIKICPKCQAWTVGEGGLCTTCGTRLAETEYTDLYWKLDKSERKHILHDVAVKMGLSEDKPLPLDDDEAAVCAVVEAYRKGSFTADAEVLGKVFAPTSMVSGFVGEKFVQMTGAEFVVFEAKADPTMEAAGCKFRCEVESVRVDGPIAHVRFREYDAAGTDYVTYFQLAKGPEGWAVVSKVFVTV